MKNYNKFINKRYLFFAISSVCFLLTPFITINNNHVFLLSFDKQVLHLFFVSFTPQELFLMPFILISGFLFIFFITTLAGRVWCGWSCPQTILSSIYRDLIQTKLLKIYKSTKNKQQKSKDSVERKIIAMVIWGIISLIIASNFMWYFVPPEDFFQYILNPQEHFLLICIVLCIATFLFFDIVFLQDKFCVYVCPYARVQSVMFDNDTIQVIYDENRGGKIYEHDVKLNTKPQGDCIDCESCVKICPTHIDIRKGMQLECINCLDCIDACTSVMGRLNKKSLINWTSINSINTKNKVKFLRFRTIGYLVVLMLSISLLTFMASKKQHMLLNINRDSELYSIKFKDDNIVVKNSYIFLIQNTDIKDHEYYFKLDRDDINIEKPKKAIKIPKKSKRKIIVTLKTDSNFVFDKESDTIVPLDVFAYSIDDDKINITKKTNFIYPSIENISKHKKSKHKER